MEEINIEVLSQLLSDNLGNKLTPALANGIIYMLLQAAKTKTETESTN